MRGTKSAAEHRGANGKFSLGKVSEDSGYCVGAVVETRMGVGDVSSVKKSGIRDSSGITESGILAGNGLRDVWILGEPAFRGMGLVFDVSAPISGVISNMPTNEQTVEIKRGRFPLVLDVCSPRPL